MNTQNLRIGTKLFLAFTVTTLVTVLLAFMAWQQMRAIDRASEDISMNWLPSVQSLGEMRIAANRVRRTESEAFLPQASELTARYKVELAERNKGLSAAEAVYVPLITEGEERRLYERFKLERAAYMAEQQKMAAMPETDREQVTAVFLGSSELAFDKMVESLGELAKLNRAGSDKAQATGRDVFAQAQVTLLVLTLLAVAIAAALATWITRLITRPIGRAVEIAQGVAGGDLTMQIDVAGRDESAQLMQALSEMRSALSLVVGDVRGNAEGVATASAEIAQGNNDLSGRTEQQASALEQTAASMEELSSTVRNNAENAQQASELAARASTVAQRSGEDVSAMVTTMRTIDQASRSIGEITGVIDSIAFQTNILALNAAVEAARAGEQGRGFAVVATEVRSLAKRSADAAKEIKALIDTSGARVREGSAQADRAGTSMTQVQDVIRQVASIVSEISVATREQSDGIAQVGDAVSQMDQVTQQNAALVEESAAAASSLKHQAEQLVTSVAVFRIDGGTPALAQRRDPAPRAPTAALPSAPRPALKSPAAPKKPAAPASPPVRKPVPALTADDDWSSF